MAVIGGEGGIRTHVPVTRQDAFEAPPLRPLRYLSGRQPSYPYYRVPPGACLSNRNTLLAPNTEKRLQQRTAFLPADARDNFEPVVVPGQIAAAHGRADGAGLRLRRAVHQRRDASMDRRTHAQQARLDRHAQRRAEEPVVADTARGVAD